MTEAIKKLFEEHEIIMEAINLAKQAGQLIGKDDARYEKSLRTLIRFFRYYADGFHHYKEEQILFPEMSKRNELLDDGVLKEMLENHEDFRNMISKIEKLLNEKDFANAQVQLDKYTEAMLDHIAVENDEVFHSAESLMDEDELERMNFRFVDSDREVAEGANDGIQVDKAELENELNELKKEFFNLA
ncbi:MAG: hemerythrin domain-containing protein [Bacteroidia bacterium]|nr:hemerythrin domain-containing protein [Bacteroidia bacterium]MCZ2277530.1 hemerythrin domain-containing protein [Bacteroidia bacterium]